MFGSDPIDLIEGRPRCHSGRLVGSVCWVRRISANSRSSRTRAANSEAGGATSGQLGNNHLAAMLFQRAAGVRFSFVHFDGGAPATNALLGGHVDLADLTAGTPPEVVEVLAGAVKRAMENETVKKRMDELGLVQRYMGPAEYTKYWDEVEAQTRPLLEELLKEQKK